ncbi:4-coumarate-CoA ligase [Eremomyces bilateralis CBS 781.70]|uniref:4-coumarate-CoA ligase n=1 Tax=Eremomyces bilateralis CBS 781.70 TaxID=1392243 RepID=A0A6G1G9Y7_9PEZI|nr:4-coumarate-CoA ligase [Eremomyces bilateralis CBS 781.70]KAF1814756.1 4-coumarate-CoA ligase [Eremomyces bilateralis CBS 781.70]
MPQRSQYNIDIPSTNILSYLFPENSIPSEKPLWIDSVNPNSKSLSPKQLRYWCKRVGHGLRSRYGLQDGDLVLMLSNNHIFIPVAYLGVAGAGLIFSGCNPSYTTREIARQITDSCCKIILVEPGLSGVALEAAQAASFPTKNILLFSDAPCDSQSGLLDWQTALPDTREAQSWRWPPLTGKCSADTVAVLNYSSGTTGLPKGVMISHRNLIANVEQSIFMRNLPESSTAGQQDERWLGFLPLYHAYGQLWTILAACRMQTPCYMMSKFDLMAFLSNIQKYRITHLQTAPPVIVMLAKRPECNSFDLSSLRNIVSGAAPLANTLQNEVSDKYNLRIVQTYGMTELTCSTLHVPGNLDDRSGSVGLIDPNDEVKLLDNQGREVAMGERGEVWVRGPNVCMGYWRNPTANAETFDSDGFLRTGDVAVRDDRGWYWIVDRIKELIKVKGFQVAPAELEAVLLEHPGVADAAVVGLKGEHEEQPMAYVTLKTEALGKLSETALREWVNAKVARHKHLTGGVYFVDIIPKSPSGKIQRMTMRTWAAEKAKEMAGTPAVKAKL